MYLFIQKDEYGSFVQTQTLQQTHQHQLQCYSKLEVFKSFCEETLFVGDAQDNQMSLLQFILNSSQETNLTSLLQVNYEHFTHVLKKLRVWITYQNTLHYDFPIVLKKDSSPQFEPMQKSKVELETQWFYPSFQISHQGVYPTIQEEGLTLTNMCKNSNVAPSKINIFYP